VLDPPVVVPEYQDAAKAVENIASFTSDRRHPIGPTSEPGADLSRQVAELSWYHTIELPHGVVTPGSYDHRPLVPHYGLPETLAGRRAIDIATADGFWAFEMERRGADVTAVDVARLVDHDFPPSVRAAFIAAGVDRPTGAGFALAHEALGSSVRRWEQSIYDLDDAELGKFDQVHVADVLLHLERPLDALRRIHAVTGGQALIADTIEAAMPPGGMRYLGSWDRVTYWLPGLETLVQMVADAGFTSVRVHALYSLAVTSAADAIGPWRVALVATP
jgi:tRNA (mo5U34)-methyltransferase